MLRSWSSTSRPPSRATRVPGGNGAVANRPAPAIE